jgi:hypothetical protein
MTDETISLLQRAAVAAVNELRRLNDAALSPPWLADAAEALGEVRPEDGAPLALNWTQVIAAIHELREDRDHWKLRAERAEYTQNSGVCYAPLLTDPRPCGLSRGHAGEHKP